MTFPIFVFMAIYIHKLPRITISTGNQWPTVTITHPLQVIMEETGYISFKFIWENIQKGISNLSKKCKQTLS